MMPKPSDPPSVKAQKEAHMAMMKNMNVPLTGDADVDFVRGMMGHGFKFQNPNAKGACGCGESFTV